MRRARPRRARAARARAGFTVLEVMIALLVLSVGLLALAGLSVTASVAARLGTRQTIAAAVAQSRFDSLASVPCRGLAAAAAGATSATGGTAVTRGVTERWVVTDGFNVKHFVDTLTVPGRTVPLVYRTVLPCRD